MNLCIILCWVKVVLISWFSSWDYCSNKAECLLLGFQNFQSLADISGNLSEIDLFIIDFVRAGQGSLKTYWIVPKIHRATNFCLYPLRRKYFSILIDPGVKRCPCERGAINVPGAWYENIREPKIFCDVTSQLNVALISAQIWSNSSISPLKFQSKKKIQTLERNINIVEWFLMNMHARTFKVLSQ